MKSRILRFVVFAAMLLASEWGLASRDVRAGEATVIDGDTVQVDGKTVQLYGIDAPELGQLCDANGNMQPCGVQAALALQKLLTMGKSSFHCSPWTGGDPTEVAGAKVEICEVGDEDVGQVMLHGGYSVALPGSFPDYAEAQEQAQQANLGLWHSEFVMPWLWRQGERLPGGKTDCNVKAVTDAQGRRLYHVPTDPDYDQIAADPVPGNALFCSDEEARQAGWRRPGEATPVN
jgi:endonuclease YncB( thermonuclease family)